MVPPPVLRVPNPFPALVGPSSVGLGLVPGQSPGGLSRMGVKILPWRGPAGPQHPDRFPSTGPNFYTPRAVDLKRLPSDSPCQGLFR